MGAPPVSRLVSCGRVESGESRRWKTRDFEKNASVHEYRPSSARFHFVEQVHTNLIWALGYNIVAIPLAAGAFLPGWGLMLSPALAGAIMSCSSVAVVTNSLLLRRTLERRLSAG